MIVKNPCSFHCADLKHGVIQCNSWTITKWAITRLMVSWMIAGILGNCRAGGMVIRRLGPRSLQRTGRMNDVHYHFLNHQFRSSGIQGTPTCCQREVTVWNLNGLNHTPLQFTVELPKLSLEQAASLSFCFPLSLSVLCSLYLPLSVRHPNISYGHCVAFRGRFISFRGR